jgi:hypothetical protein
MKINLADTVYHKITFSIMFLVISLLIVTNSSAQTAADPNFYIFLCFGQSNMEGQGTIEG